MEVLKRAWRVKMKFDFNNLQDDSKNERRR